MRYTYTALVYTLLLHTLHLCTSTPRLDHYSKLTIHPELTTLVPKMASRSAAAHVVGLVAYREEYELMPTGLDQDLLWSRSW
jgi:hypothetical protein